MTVLDYCDRCNQPGHLARDCSLAWRQYVFCKPLPQSDRELQRMLKDRVTMQCCYACAALDHFGDECPGPRKSIEWSAFHEPSLEFLYQAAISTKGSEKKTQKQQQHIPKESSSKRRQHSPPRQRHDEVAADGSNYYEINDGSYHPARERSRDQSFGGRGRHQESPPRKRRPAKDDRDPPRTSSKTNHRGTYQGGYKRA